MPPERGRLPSKHDDILAPVHCLRGVSIRIRAKKIVVLPSIVTTPPFPDQTGGNQDQKPADYFNPFHERIPRLFVDPSSRQYKCRDVRPARPASTEGAPVVDSNSTNTPTNPSERQFATTGRLTRKVEPSPGTLSTSTVPWWFSTMAWTMARPRPEWPLEGPRAGSTR